MKNFISYLVIITLFINLSACKKDLPLLQNKGDDTNATPFSTSVAGLHRPLTVVTIAGKRGEIGRTDGDGKTARFYYPLGLDILDDGTLYIADFFNSNIRKITNANVVSTVNIPNSKGGQMLNGPSDIVVQSDGTINILTYDLDWITQHKVWIIKPNGDVQTPDHKNSPTTSNYNSYVYNDLVRDPYSSYLLLGGYFNNHSGYVYGLTERFEVKNNFIGTHEYKLPADSLATFDRLNPQITKLFCGYNGVKYIVMNNRTIYKLTPTGVFTQICRNLAFINITAIVGTKDSRSLYIVDRGAIKTISNNKLTYLAGPQKPYDGGDGIGSSADVRASKIVLSKDEGTLYFTDENTVRKIYLR
jgi:hypothetical protein